jgi:uncharacterized protein (TIGR02391 family)
MADLFTIFEQFVRNSNRLSDEPNEEIGGAHPFENQNIDAGFPSRVRELFDNAHYSEATFEAFKYIDKQVASQSGIHKSGEALMMDAFNVDSPKINIATFSGASGVDEQRGYRFLFAGALVGIRNPRGHEHSVVDSPDVCLAHLAFASMLLRKLRASK